MRVSKSGCIGGRSLAIMALTSLAAGCRIIKTAGCLTLGVVGLAGYAVYKTGEVAVTGVGKAAKATGSAMSSSSKPVSTVVYRGNEFKTEYPAGFTRVWVASGEAFKKARFQDMDGSSDGRSGCLTARTWDKVEITLKIKGLGMDNTEVRIQVGSEGDLKTSEVLHQLIQNELGQGGAS
jgi:hypothetical protein